MMRNAWRWLVCLACVVTGGTALAQRPPMMPPAFAGGIPGMVQMQAMAMQRHQVRTLLYREALEELRRNPQAADVPGCPPAAARTRAASPGGDGSRSRNTRPRQPGTRPAP